MNSFIQHYTGDGVTNSYVISFPYITFRDIEVYVNGVGSGNWTLSSDATTITLLPIPNVGDIVSVERWTDLDAVASFVPAETLQLSNLSVSQLQTLHISEEAAALAASALLFNDSINAWDGKTFRIANVGTPVNPTDAANLAYVTAALASSTGYVPPDSATIASSNAAALAASVAATADAADVTTKLSTAQAAVVSFGLLLTELNALNNNPPPSGATIVSLLDTLFGSTVWRTPTTVLPSATTYTASGTWTNPYVSTTSGPQMAIIEVWGDGGAGASASSSYPFYGIMGATQSMPGGAGGGYNRTTVPLVTLPNTVAVTVGQGGAPQYGFGTGMHGTGSSFGTVLTVGGGHGAISPYSGGGGGGPQGPGQGANGIGQDVGGLPSYQGVSFQSPGTGGFFPSNTPFLQLNTTVSKQPIGGVYHGGGGGAGQNSFGILYPIGETGPVPAGQVYRYSNGWLQTAIPFYEAPYNSMDGAASIYGGGGGGGGFCYPVNAGTAFNQLYSAYVSVTHAPFDVVYQIPQWFTQGQGGVSAHSGSGGAGGALGQPGANGTAPGGGGGGAGVTAGGTWANNKTGPLGGHGARGQVRVTIW